METITTLVDTINDIQSHQKSGVLMVTALAGMASEATTHTFTLRFDTGDLVRSVGPAGTMGAEALHQLAALEFLQQMRWMPLNKSNSAPRAEISGRELAEIFGFSQAAHLMQAQLDTQRQDTLRLMSHVEQVMRQFYLGDYQAELQRICAEHPPEQEPDNFLFACAQVLAPLIGKEETRRLLLTPQKA
jgi:hypothetical protein